MSEGDEGKVEKRKDNRQIETRKKRIFQRKKDKGRGGRRDRVQKKGIANYKKQKELREWKNQNAIDGRLEIRKEEILKYLKKDRRKRDGKEY